MGELSGIFSKKEGAKKTRRNRKVRGAKWSQKKNTRGKINLWILSIKKAKAELGLQGKFVLLNRGVDGVNLYNKSKKIHEALKINKTGARSGGGVNMPANFFQVSDGGGLVDSAATQWDTAGGNTTGGALDENTFGNNLHQ
jgi:hypothetical protein